MRREEAEALHSVAVFKRAGFSYEEWATDFPGEDEFVTRKFWNSVDVSEGNWRPV